MRQGDTFGPVPSIYNEIAVADAGMWPEAELAKDPRRVEELCVVDVLAVSSGGQVPPQRWPLFC